MYANDKIPVNDKSATKSAIAERYIRSVMLDV